MPTVWNVRDPKCPPTAIYVGRPTKWGNPHRVGWCPVCRCTHARGAALAAYLVDLQTTPAGQALQQAMRVELRGCDVCCWCAPQRCHGHSIVEIANAE